MRLSVVVPVLDEEARIEAHLAASMRVPSVDEIIVVDGGSRDRTVELVGRFRDVRLLAAAAGRGTQQNAGARAASGDVLLFLHADVLLPLDAAEWIRWALADPGVVAGAFRTWTVCDEGSSRLAPLLHLADLRSRWAALPYGDQAIFVRASAFEQAGGFPDQPLMEDVELCRRLRRLGRLRTVPSSVCVSGRRFLSRPLYYFAMARTLPLLYRLGMPARTLAALYGNPR